MIILRQYVTSFAEVVEFYNAWMPYAVPQGTRIPGLPDAWLGLPWKIDQDRDGGWCAIVLKD